MTAAGAVSYGYDANGNQTSRDTDIFIYDHENRLTNSTTGGVNGVYAYNGDGLRMSRSIGGTAVSYTWDVTLPLPVVLQDSQGNSYVYGLDLISRTNSGGVQEYYLYDGLGSTAGLTDGAGATVATYQYDVFGAIRGQTGSSPNEFTFTGEQVDSTGFQYLRARYYDPATGRFLSQDPLPGRNLYAYVGNNPVNRIDPTGLGWTTDDWRWEKDKEGGNFGGGSTGTPRSKPIPVRHPTPPCGAIANSACCYTPEEPYGFICALPGAGRGGLPSFSDMADTLGDFLSDAVGVCAPCRKIAGDVVTAYKCIKNPLVAAAAGTTSVVVYAYTGEEWAATATGATVVVGLCTVVVVVKHETGVDPLHP